MGHRETRQGTILILVNFCNLNWGEKGEEQSH